MINKVLIGWTSRLFDSNLNTNGRENKEQYFCNEYYTIININFEKYILELIIDENFIEVDLKNNQQIRFCHSTKTIEIFSNEPFNCYNMENQINNFLINFDRQLLRYWILKPVIRLENLENFHILHERFTIDINSKRNLEANNKRFNTFKIKYKVFDSESIFLLNNSENYSKLINYEKEFLNILSKMNLKLAWHIMVLLSSGKLIYPLDISINFLTFLLEEGNSNEQLINSINQIKYNKFKIKNLDYELLLKKARKNYIKSNTNDSLIYTKRIFVTPSLIIFIEESIDQKNRILNEYKNYTDNFIRCTFSNDKMKKISYVFNKAIPIIENIKKILTNGIYLISKKYVFFQYSNSQIKEHSVWLIHEEGEFRVDKIFSKIGDFTEEKVISKNASRKGLTLTSCKKIENIDFKPETIKDIKGKVDFFEHEFSNRIYINKEEKFIYKLNKKENQNFTDGSGLISLDLAIKYSGNPDNMSAFQVRIGGAKGILVLDPKLKNNTILLRESMIKFNSYNNSNLYIIRNSTFSIGYINKQIIHILNQLGISNKIFLDSLEEHIILLENIKKMNNNLNLEIFKTNNFINNLKNKFVFTKKYKNNPFIKGIIETLFMSSLQDLKNKCNLFIEKAAKFLGVPDHYGLLKENQIFCKIKKPNNEEIIIKGKVLVTKNPCLYYGDIRLVDAVDIQDLHHLTNVIVFPTVGMRPLQKLLRFRWRRLCYYLG